LTTSTLRSPGSNPSSGSPNLDVYKLERLRYLRDLELEQIRRENQAHRELVTRYTADPILWAHERLQEETWSKQDEILQALVDHDKVAVRSCHGVGKSHIASRAVGWWMDTHDREDVFVVTTAPTFPQVRVVLWRYIRQMHRRAGLPGRCNQVEWLIDDEIVAYGRKPADHDAAGFQGVHGQVLIVVDEACGIPETLWHAIESLATNEGCKILAIGNPDDPTSYFKRICNPGSTWHKVKISAYDSPNLTGEVVSPKLSRALVSRAWVDEKVIDWGRDNPVFVSKVLGEFPTQDPHAVVRLEDIYRCRLVDVPWADHELLPVELGVDVGGGGDLTVIRERRGPVAGRQWSSRSDRPEELAPFVCEAIAITGATHVKVDSNGIGFGLVGELRNRGRRGEHRASVSAVNVSESASDPAKWYRLRDEMWWNARERCAAGLWDLSQMDDADGTISELVEPRWGLDVAGRIKVESKDDTRERLDGRSPDRADALLLAYHQPAASLTRFMDQLGGARGQ